MDCLKYRCCHGCIIWMFVIVLSKHYTNVKCNLQFRSIDLDGHKELSVGGSTLKNIIIHILLQKCSETCLTSLNIVRGNWVKLPFWSTKWPKGQIFDSRPHWHFIIFEKCENWVDWLVDSWLGVVYFETLFQPFSAFFLHFKPFSVISRLKSTKNVWKWTCF